MNRFKIAQPIALVATVLSVIGFIIGRETEKGLFLMMLGMTIGIVSYLFGGLLTAARMAGSIAKWGWLLTPFGSSSTISICLFKNGRIRSIISLYE